MKVVPFTEYFDELLRNLADSIDRLAEEYGWEEHENVRVVFHAYKPLKNIETEVILKLAERYSRYHFMFAFAKLSSHHPFYLFNETRGKGREFEYLAPDRGANARLSERSCLLQIRGPSRIRGQRLSAPLLVTLHEKSTFTDMFYICQQILDFSHLSWRTFFPSYKPVTVLYSELMAEMCGKLQLVPGWDERVLDMHFRKKQWFL
jgi:hypothetical protein